MSLGKVDDKVGRFATAYEYLKSIGRAHKQQDIAERMSTDKANVSRAMNGDARYLTNRFLSRFNRAYGNIFNLEWLLNGVGDMCCGVLDEQLEREIAEETGRVQSIGDNSNHNTQTMTDTALTKENELLKKRIQEKDKALEEKNEEIKFLRSLIQRNAD